jgi:CheY-like chemotaxis protein
VEKLMTNPFDGLTALVVEDDGVVREDIAAWFRQQGWSVFETAIGAGALQLIREADRLHLLFTDINLADAITGWDVAEAGRVSHPDLRWRPLAQSTQSCSREPPPLRGSRTQTCVS